AALQEAADVFQAVLDAHDRETWIGVPWADLMSERGAVLQTLGRRLASAELLEESVRCFVAATEGHCSELWSDPRAVMESQLGLAQARLAAWRGGRGAAERGVSLCRAAEAELEREGDALILAGARRHLGEALIALGELAAAQGPLQEARVWLLRAQEV